MMKHKYILTLSMTLFLLTACGSRQAPKRIIEIKTLPSVPVVKHTTPQRKIPPAPKKKIALKKVDDTIDNDNYMYPEDTRANKRDTTTQKASSSKSPQQTTLEMTKEECISMIGQDKFDKYTEMFGNETSSIKRCMMIKAMKK